MVHVFFKCMLKNGPVNKVCDIYRLQDGQLTEHWDIIEHNVEGVQSRNDNGPFWPSNSVRGLLCSITCRKSWPLLICLCEDCTLIFTNHTALLEPYSPYLMHL